MRIGDIRQGTLKIAGGHPEQALAGKLLERLYGLLKGGYPIYPGDIEYSLRILQRDRNAKLKDIFLDTVYISSASGRHAQEPRAEDVPRCHRTYDIVFGIGPAGTGKTYLAMAVAVAALLRDEVARIVLSGPRWKPARSSASCPATRGEGQPLSAPALRRAARHGGYRARAPILERGTIEVAPLAFMRGRTLNDSFVILDEAQNTTAEQMKMFLTRLGYDSKAVITGDVTQIDLPSGKRPGSRRRDRAGPTLPVSPSSTSANATSCAIAWCKKEIITAYESFKILTR